MPGNSYVHCLEGLRFSVERLRFGAFKGLGVLGLYVAIREESDDQIRNSLNTKYRLWPT